MIAEKINKTAFARSIGITKHLLEYHLKNPSAPPVGDRDAWVSFIEANGREETAPEDLRRAIALKKLEILQHTEQSLARKAAREKNEVADKSEVRTWMRSFMALLFSELDRLYGIELPSSGKGLSEVELKQLSDGLRDQLKESLRKRFEVHL